MRFCQRTSGRRFSQASRSLNMSISIWGWGSGPEAFLELSSNSAGFVRIHPSME